MPKHKGRVTEGDEKSALEVEPEQLQLFDASEYDLPTPPTPEEGDAVLEDTGPKGEPVVTAFLVYITPDGQYMASNDVNKDIVLQRPSNLDDMVAACSVIIKDLTAVETCNRTIQTQMHTAAAMAEQQRSQKIAAKLAEKGIHVPR